MSLCKKLIAILVFAAGISVGLAFLPTNEFFGIDSHNSESPSPMMVLGSQDKIKMGFKITPVGCTETNSGLTESQFRITNTHDKDYDVLIGIMFTDGDVVLDEKETKVRILAGETIDQIYLSGGVYDNPICVVQINGGYET